MLVFVFLISVKEINAQQFENGTFAYPGIYGLFEGFEGASGFGQDSYNYLFPQNSWWGSVKFVNLGLNYDLTAYPCISVSGEMNQILWYDIMSMQLTSPLIVGQHYRLTFDEKFNIDVPLTFEATYQSQTYGNLIHTVPAHNAFIMEWRTREFEFIAQDSAQFINVYIQQGPDLEYIDASIALNNFHLEQVNDLVLSTAENKPTPSKKYDVYALDGRKLFSQVFIFEIPSGVYILRAENEVLKLVK